MWVPTLLLLSAALTGQPTAPPKPASITGTLANALTGEPVGKVQVRLSRESSRGGPPQSAATATDAAGRFTFEGIEPATYRLSAQKPGFLTMQYGARRGASRGTPIQLETGQQLTIDWKILPQGVITGRIVDEDGDPIANASVSVSRVTPSTRARDDERSTNTNDLGDFRIPNLPTGRYRVAASTSQRRSGEPLVLTGRQQPQREYAPTFYPGSLDPATAALVEVTPGKESGGIQFALIKTPVYRVRGRVSAPGALPSNLSVFLRSKSGASRWGGPGSGARVRPDGSFEISQVLPGSYTLYASAMERGPRAMGRAALEVSADIDNATVTLSPPLSLTGTVKIEGQGTPDYGRGQIYLRSTESSGPMGGAPGQVKPDGTFRIENLMPEKYALIPFGFPDNLYLRAVRLGTQTVAGELDLANATPGLVLNVVLSPNAATVTGTVKEKDKPAGGVQVSLLPDQMTPSEAWRVKQATTDQNGAFTIKGVAPGSYRLYALAEPILAADLDPEFLGSHASHAAKLSVKEGAREQVETELIDIDPERK